MYIEKNVLYGYKPSNISNVINTHMTGSRIVEDNIYRSLRYVIISYGSHPCAYIQVPEDNGLVKDVDDCDDVNIAVHGGVTYLHKSLHPEIVPDSMKEGYLWVGWDYAHAGDYTYYHQSIDDIFGIEPIGHVWTLKELCNDCQLAIDELLESADD